MEVAEGGKDTISEAVVKNNENDQQHSTLNINSGLDAFLFCCVALIDFNPFLYFELKRDFFFLDRMQSGFLPRSSMHNCF